MDEECWPKCFERSAIWKYCALPEPCFILSSLIPCYPIYQLGPVVHAVAWQQFHVTTACCSQPMGYCGVLRVIESLCACILCPLGCTVSLACIYYVKTYPRNLEKMRKLTPMVVPCLMVCTKPEPVRPPSSDQEPKPPPPKSARTRIDFIVDL